MILIFKNRYDAGEKLWNRISELINDDTHILAVPEGGIQIAEYTCKKLNKPLDIILCKKLRYPFSEISFMGAVAEEDLFVINEEATAYLGISEEYINTELKTQLESMKKDKETYERTEQLDILDRNVVVIADGITTGLTMLTIIKYLQLHKAKSILIACSVALRDAVYMLENNGVNVIALHMPEKIDKIDSYYEKNEPLSEAYLASVLNNYKSESGKSSSLMYRH